MKYLFVNSVAGYGSTGKITADQCRRLTAEGNECVLAYGRMQATCDGLRAKRIGGRLDVYWHVLMTRLFDLHGLCSRHATKEFLRWADQYNPDVVWLHNIHDYYINYELLFAWMKQHPEKKFYWTLHDCWAFTGHCSHFTYVGCDQWRAGCHKGRCPQLDQYPKTFCSWNAGRNWNRKREAFTGVSNLTLITPSSWLKNLVQQSFLSEYPVEVRPNVVNREIFKPVESTFREEHHLENKIVLLAVSNVWNDRKGYQDILQLRKMMDDRYAFVIVGLNNQQLRELPGNMIGLRRTANQRELAEIYSSADLLLNPSYEETFSMTTAEAAACGTMPVVYQGTACEEVAKAVGGIVVPMGVENLKKAVMEYVGVNCEQITSQSPVNEK